MRTPPRDDLRFSNTTDILQKKTLWFIGVEVEQETSALPAKKKILDPPLILFYHYGNQLERLSSSGCCALTDHVSLLVITICLFFLLCLNDVRYVVIYGNSANKQ